jgi:hypothetical protein
MINAIAIGSIAMSLLATPVISEPTTVPPSERITIDVVSANGSGCPAGGEGAAAISVSEDNTAFTVTYSKYTALVGPEAQATDARKNCQLGLRVNVPQGFTYAVAQADFRGYAALEKGASAVQKSNYYFQGTSPTASVSHPISGAYDGDWQFTDKADLAAIVWHPCGAKRNLNINTELRVNKGTSDPTKTSYITMDSTDGNIDTIYHFAWKKCDQ